MNINLFSWAPLSSRALCHRLVSRRSLKKPKSALLKSRVVNLFFTLFYALRLLNSTNSWSLQPKLPLTFTFSTSSSLLMKYEVEHLSSLTLLSLGGGIYHQCAPGTPWIFYALLFCPDIWVFEATHEDNGL